MAEMATRGRGPQPVVPVAELLDRLARAPHESDVDCERLAVSVGTLIRREGRGPHAVDRPVRPRGQRPVRCASDEDGPNRVRRTAVAAGALLAASSVFGAAILSDATGFSGLTGSADGLEPPPGSQPDPTPLLPSGYQNVAAGGAPALVDLAAFTPVQNPLPAQWVAPGQIPTQQIGAAAAPAAGAAPGAVEAGQGGVVGTGPGTVGGVVDPVVPGPVGDVVDDVVDPDLPDLPDPVEDVLDDVVDDVVEPNIPDLPDPVEDVIDDVVQPNIPDLPNPVEDVVDDVFDDVVEPNLPDLPDSVPDLPDPIGGMGDDLPALDAVGEVVDVVDPVLPDEAGETVDPGSVVDIDEAVDSVPLTEGVPDIDDTDPAENVLDAGADTADAVLEPAKKLAEDPQSGGDSATDEVTELIDEGTDSIADGVDGAVDDGVLDDEESAPSDEESNSNRSEDGDGRTPAILGLAQVDESIENAGTKAIAALS